ncbi:MAG: aspartate aminotransferase family protein [Planctomycetota bacterium]
MSLDPDLEEMRRIGHAAIDRATAHLAALRDRRVVTPPDAAALRALVDEPLPVEGRGLDDTLERFFADLLPRATLVNHPRFFAYVPGPGSFAGAVGEWLAAATNTFVGTWLGGAVMAQLEVQTLGWLAAALGLDGHRHGIVTSGGSMANLGALAAALADRDRDRAVVYVGDQAHYSIAKAARVLGLAADRVRAVASDGDQRLDLGALRAALDRDRAQGLQPAAVAATAGTTSTGAVDPLPQLADLCRAQGLWLHCDAAYGGALALLPQGRALLAGWERADSITVDPHKWFYAPFECGCLLVRDPRPLRRAFGGDADYMQDIPRDETNFFALGPELSRGNRALKLWFLLRGHGTAAIARHVQQDLDHCRLAHDLLARDPRVEIVTPQRMSMFSFARRGDDAATRALVPKLIRCGFTMLSSTLVGGRYAVRVCVANHRTTADDVRASMQRVLELLD